MIQFLNKWTGEIHELPDKSPEEIRDAWLALKETIDSCKRAQDKLKPKVDSLITKDTYQVGDYQFRRMITQRKNYDKTVMRELLDEDTLDLFLIPDKPKVDNWLKENIESLGETSTQLRKSMIPVGNPYTTIRLEKV